TYVAIVAEVEIDRTTGKIWAKKFTVAHDCGLVINPEGLKHTIEGNIVQGTSRTLWEEVKFDSKNVTSVDWMTYPILDITETPETIDIVLINRPEIAPAGAGEPSIRPIGAARDLGRRHGGNASADPARRAAALARHAADLEPAGGPFDRRGLRRRDRNLGGEFWRVRAGAALCRRGHGRHDPHQGRDLPGA